MGIKTLPKTGLRIGVTLFIRDSQQSLWENGIFQNCYFLVELLKKSKIAKSVFLVNGGPGNPAEAGAFLANTPAPVLSLQQAMNELDILIELSSQLDKDWAAEFVKKGGRVIGMHVANDYIIDVERMAFELDPGFRMEPVPYSEVWTLPAFQKTCASYYQCALHVPVYVMPHIWGSKLLEQGLAAHDSGGRFGYQPGRQSWRVAVLEANICTVKTSHLPLLLTDVAYRMNPRMLDYLRVYGALQLKEHQQFIAYAQSMDVVSHGRATFEGRFPIFEIMGPQCDAIVSHHWENGQNYLYYEALYGGFPLIHNSDFLDGCGYAYKNFDPKDGALALLEAFAGHDKQLEEYRTKANRFLATLSPENEANIQAFEIAIKRVAASKPV